MKNITMSVFTEFKKALKSSIFTGTALFSLFIALMLGILFFIVKNPEMAQASVIIRAKATMLGTADWISFFSVMNLMIAIIGMIGFGFVTSWVFGREYADKTLKDLLALPVARQNIVLAKHIIIIFWSIFISLTMFAFSFLAGFITGLEGWSFNLLAINIKRYFIVMLLNIMLCPVISFLASYGRGYILPFAFIFLMMLVSNFAINISENAKYIPWAVPLIYAGANLKEGMDINIASVLVLILTGIAGLIGTLCWWRYADQY
jgi:ABC-2 type transport system permease protein